MISSYNGGITGCRLNIANIPEKSMKMSNIFTLVGMRGDGSSYRLSLSYGSTFLIIIYAKRMMIITNVTITNRIEKLEIKFSIFTLVIKLSNGKKTKPTTARIIFSIFL